MVEPTTKAAEAAGAAMSATTDHTDSRDFVRDLVREHLPSFPVKRVRRLVTDTTEFMSIDYGDVIQGWVAATSWYSGTNPSDASAWKTPSTGSSGARKSKPAIPAILKLEFHETFTQQVGQLAVRCYRSPNKESRILDLVRGDKRFMQGETVHDEVGNNVRILEMIRGKRLDTVVDAIEATHKEYFFNHLPTVLDKFIGCCEAIALLHSHGERHGDVRRDHIWVESGTGEYRWIDFDYTYEFQENPFGLDIFGLGSSLLYLVGKQIHHQPGCRFTARPPCRFSVTGRLLHGPEQQAHEHTPCLSVYPGTAEQDSAAFFPERGNLLFHGTGFS